MSNKGTQPVNYNTEDGNYTSEFLQQNIRNETKHGTYTIRKEIHPFDATRRTYHAYFEDGTPYYIGRESMADLVDYMNIMHPELNFVTEGC